MVAEIWREWYVMSGLIFQHMSTGMVVAYPAILLPAITGHGGDIVATADEASWFVTSYSLTGPIGFLILPAVMQKYGRILTHIIINAITLSGSVIIALAPNIPTLIAGRSIQGITFGGWYLSCIMVAEYAHPKRRGFFIGFKLAASHMAEMICHAFGFTNLTWRQIMWLSAIPSILAILVTLKWPESPLWLAYIGRYDDCAVAFEWLRGKQSNRELKSLIFVQKQRRKLKINYSTFIGFLEVFRTKEFQKPFAVAAVLVVLFQACGGYYLASYVVEIMTKLTGGRSRALYTNVVLDGFKTIGILISCWVVSLFDRRTVLFKCGSLSCILLASVSVFSYLESRNILVIKWLLPCILVIYYVLCFGTINSVIIIVMIEIFPTRYKGVGSCIIGILLSVSSITTVKLTVILVSVLEVYGMFLVYIVMCMASVICLYYIMPETKDKTLQDIETDFLEVMLTYNYEGEFQMKKPVKCESGYSHTDGSVREYHNHTTY